MAEKKRKDDVSKLSFEESIRLLKEIVDKIEQGQIPLQDSLDQYEKGMSLIKHCRGILQKAEKRIEKISREEQAEEETAEEQSEPESSGDQGDPDDKGLF